MKKLHTLFIVVFFISCTSNTIFKKPKDLITRDTMCLLMQDMLIASSSKFVKNKNKQKRINYMAFVYEKYKIDSARFQKSNFYYTSKIDLYEEIINDAKMQLEEKKEFYSKMKTERDSIKKDSIKNAKTKRVLKNKDTIAYFKELNKQLEEKEVHQKYLFNFFKPLKLW